MPKKSLERSSVLALIPARGGSKGLPRKNILSLNGKPLLAWSIEAAKKSRYIDQVMVSTEDDEIIEIATQWGASVPFKRPPHLAQDHIPSMEVILHTLHQLESEGTVFKTLVLLQPTSPLRLAKHIDEALELFESKKANAVLSVSVAEHPPVWINKLPPDLSMENFVSPEVRGKNRQELGPYYRLNGAIYIANWDFIQTSKDWFSDKTYAYIMDQRYSIDIDTMKDFVFAETMMKMDRI